MLLGCSSLEAPSPEVKLLKEVPVTENDQHGQEDYIPKDLYDSINHLKKLLKAEQVLDMKNGTEDDMIKYHFGLGMWMRNNWGLWAGSGLSDWFNSIGIFHPDDMSGIILDSLWRDLNGEKLQLEEQIKYYKDYWDQVEQPNETE